MRALDTNVLVRFLVKDDLQQATRVLMLFQQAETKQEEFWIPSLVILELIWVLESVYQVSRSAILDTIDDLLKVSILRFEARSAVQAFLRESRNSSLDLSDLLIAQTALHAGCSEVLTFDKRATKHRHFRSL